MIIIDPIFYYAIAGACGAFISDILKDNKIALPKYKCGELSLGFLGTMLIGACAGQYIDGGITTAFMGGFMGKVVIVNLIPKTNGTATETN